MNVLVTGSRMPFALDEIRKLGRRGHHVIAADTLRTAPGSRSRWAEAHARVASPQYRPERFIAEVRRLVEKHAIDVIVPCFEEVFHLAQHREELGAELFASELELLTRVHSKAAFNRLARAIGLCAPASTVATDRESLAAAAASYERFFARPVWSRGSIDLYTNAGPLAGALQLEGCQPTLQHPWVVQEYVDGADVCTFSVARRGRVVLHCTYVHPLEIEHGGGIVFESIDDPEALDCVSRLVAATGYHGQLGMDFRRNGDGLVALECNPRPTAGVHLASDVLVADALFAEPPTEPRVVPAGVRKKYASAILRDLLLHAAHARRDLGYLLHDGIDDIYAERGDRLPALFQVLSYAHVLAYRIRHGRTARRRATLMAAYFDGIEWNGEEIP